MAVKMRALLAVLMLSVSIPALATTHNISSGASCSTIQSTIQGSSSGDTVAFAAGNYTINCLTNIPNGVSLTGPVVAMTSSGIGNPTAIFNGSVGSNWAFSYGAGSTAATIQYLEWNGGEPQPDGGGFLYMNWGVNNLTIQFNNIHGNQASLSQDGVFEDSLLFFDGATPNTGGAQIDNNNTVQWNKFGGGNDCSNVNGLLVYGARGAPGCDSDHPTANCYYDAVGGECAAIGVHTQTNNFTINNNTISKQEQGMKLYEGGNVGGTATDQFFITNTIIRDNDICCWWRIAIEAQQTPNANTDMGGEVYYANSVHDQQSNPGFGSWAFSMPQWDWFTVNIARNTSLYGNLMVGNVAPGGGGYIPGAFEWTSNNGQNFNNTLQGYWACDNQVNVNPNNQPGLVPSQATASNNVWQAFSGCFINNDYSVTGHGPLQSGNQTSTSVNSYQSAAPTISPTPSGAYSSSISVTLSDNGFANGGIGAQGNTTIYYTLDGSVPTVTSPNFCNANTTVANPTNSCTITVSPGTTVKALGMWGSINQPKSYPSGYGFFPSGVVSATYVSGGNTVATPTFNPVSGTTFTGSLLNVSVATATSGATLHCTTDGTTPTPSSATYTGPFSLGASATIECLGTFPGYTNSAVATATYTKSSAPTVTLTGASLSCAGASHSMITGATSQCTMTCTYSDSSTTSCNNPDTHGNGVSSWASSNSAFVSVSSSGLATGVAPGTANITATVGAIQSSWSMTDSAPTSGFSIPAGSSTTTIQNTINSATSALGANTVSFASGTYSVTPITVACPSGSLTITGPATGYPQAFNARPTARLVNANSGESPWMFQIAGGCNKPINILYLECDGNRPTSGGGCVNQGGGNSSGLTIKYNYFHGNQEQAPFACGTDWCYDDDNANLIRISGDRFEVNTGTVIQYNVLGNPSAGDCSNVMTWVGANQAAAGKWLGYDSYGGSCTALGVAGETTNFDFEYNIVQQQEQGTKWFEGCQSDDPQYPSCKFYQVNDVVAHNDFGFIHRIVTETQQSPETIGRPFAWNFNDFHDPIATSFGSWVLSAAQNFYTNYIGNVILYNGSGTATNSPGSAEFWGDGNYNNNLVQGIVECGLQYESGGSSNVMTIQNNIFQSSEFAPSSYACNENGGPAPSVFANNSVSTTVSPVTSAAPTISPAGGSFTGSQVVTFHNSGVTSGGQGPQGNTGTWCTFDGSNPVPKSGTALYYADGDQTTLTQNATVNCRGMWGSITQPGSYPTGFGFVPSSTVTAVFSCTTCGGGGTTPMAQAPSVSPAGPLTFTAAFNATCTANTSGANNYYTLDGSTPTPSSTLYSGPVNITASAIFSCMSALAGFTNSGTVSAAYTYSPSLGNPNQNLNGSTFPGAANEVYAVTGSNAGGYTVTSGNLCLTNGIVTAGKSTDLILALATSTTAQSATELCHGTWTNTSSTGPGCVTVAMSGCPTLTVNTGYFLNTVTNEPGQSPIGTWNCNGTCGTTPPTVGNGSYNGFFGLLTYGGPYTSLPTTLSTSTGQTQPTLWLNLVPVSGPTVSTPAISPPVTTFPSGSTLPISISDVTPGAVIHYTTDGTTPTSSSTVYVGPFPVTATTTVNAIAYATGSTPSAIATATYTAAVASFSYAYLATSNSGLNFTVLGFPIQFSAVIGYTDGTQDQITCVGTSPTDPCADSHGTYISGWTSATPGVGTISSAGIFSPVAISATGTNISAAIHYTGGTTTANWTEFVSPTPTTDFYNINLYGQITIQ